MTRLFQTLAVVALASLEAGKGLLSLSGRLSRPISEQDSSALPNVAGLASFGLPGSSSGAGNGCTSLTVLTRRSLP